MEEGWWNGPWTVDNHRKMMEWTMDNSQWQKDDGMIMDNGQWQKEDFGVDNVVPNLT